MAEIYDARGTLAWRTSCDQPYFGGAMGEEVEQIVRAVCGTFMGLTVHDVSVGPYYVMVNLTLRQFDTPAYLAKEIKRHVWEEMRRRYRWAEKARSLWKRRYIWYPGESMEWSMVEMSDIFNQMDEALSRGESMDQFK